MLCPYYPLKHNLNGYCEYRQSEDYSYFVQLNKDNKIIGLQSCQLDDKERCLLTRSVFIKNFRVQSVKMDPARNTIWFRCSPYRKLYSLLPQQSHLMYKVYDSLVPLETEQALINSSCWQWFNQKRTTDELESFLKKPIVQLLAKDLQSPLCQTDITRVPKKHVQPPQMNIIKRQHIKNCTYSNLKLFPQLDAAEKIVNTLTLEIHDHLDYLVRQHSKYNNRVQKHHILELQTRLRDIASKHDLYQWLQKFQELMHFIDKESYDQELQSTLETKVQEFPARCIQNCSAKIKKYFQKNKFIVAPHIYYRNQPTNKSVRKRTKCLKTEKVKGCGRSLKDTSVACVYGCDFCVDLDNVAHANEQADIGKYRTLSLCPTCYSTPPFLQQIQIHRLNDLVKHGMVKYAGHIEDVDPKKTRHYFEYQVDASSCKYQIFTYFKKITQRFTAVIKKKFSQVLLSQQLKEQNQARWTNVYPAF